MSGARQVTPGIRAALRGQEPSAEQWAAIAAPLGPIHVIAGAGSGKTAVMAARIVYLVEALGVAPASVLGLTFTNKAAAELEARVREALDGRAGDSDGQVTVDTYNAFAADLVKTYGVRVGVEPDADLLSEAQQYQILLGILDGQRFEHLSVRVAGVVIRKTLELAAACADHVVAPDQVVAASKAVLERAAAGERIPDWQVQAAMERTELARLVERYAAEKRLRGRIDFGDQVARAVELVERHDDLVAALRARYPHVLLDEYQDTNVAQRRLMQRLCPPGASIMAVGDARQAIYAFRGATMYNLLAFSDHFPSVGGAAAPLPLSTNFRSGRRILALANAVIEPVPAERRGGTPLVARAGAGDGEIRAALLADQFAEAAFVADQIVRAHEGGLPDGAWPAWRDVAVLVRSKRLLGPLREALEQRGVPVEVVGLSGLLETPEIVDLVATLRVIADPGANVALARLLLGPRWRIGYRHLVRLARWASRHNWGLKDVLGGEDPDPGDVAFALAEALDHLDEVEGLDDEARARLAAFADELRDLRAAARGPLLDLMQTVLERTGFWAELQASADRRAATVRQNLATFLDRVAAFAPVDGNPSLAAFLAYLDAVEDAAEPVEAVQPAPGDSVKLLTVHMAKGLEFPMVVVAGLSAGTARDGSPKHGIFPDARVADPRRAQGFPYELREDAGHLPRFAGDARAFRAQLDQRALEDERRLFYVAITRAKQLLVLTSAWWYQGSEKTPKGPSPFWREAADHEAVDVLVRGEEPDASPLTERLRDRVTWPPPTARPGERDDPLFPEGLAAAVELARADPAALAARVPAGQVDAYEAAVHAGRHLLETSQTPPAPPAPLPPRILSVNQVLTYARCPRDFYWSVVRPLPAPPRPAARLGAMVHRLLERGATRPPPPDAAARSGPAAPVPDEPVPGTEPAARTAPAGGAPGGAAAMATAPHGAWAAPHRGGADAGDVTAGPSRAEPAAGPGAWSPTGPAPGLAPGAAAATGSAAAAATGHAAGTEAGTPAAPGAGTGAWAAPGTGTGRLLGGILGDVDLAGDAPSVGADPALVERATRNFAATRYAGLDPPDAEVPVVLRVGEWVISGRIDAIFRHLDGEVEVVDWKTGRPAEPAAGGLDQLGIYAVALRELGELPEAGCLAAYCYLGGERPRIDARHLGRAELDEQARLLEATLAALGRGDYDRACGRPECEACRRGARPPRPPAPEGGTADTAIRASPWGRS